MSFQPFPFTWYTSMPRTIAADCERVYEFVPAVWCTSASCRLGAYWDAARLIDSFAPHANREMTGGEPASEECRSGIRSSGLWTKYARSRVTQPCSLYTIRSDSPVQ